HQVPASQGSSQGRLNRAAISDYRDIVVVSHFLGLGRTNHQVVKNPIDGIGDELCLAGRAASSKRVFHRLRLVQEKNEKRGVGAADLCCVGWTSVLKPVHRIFSLSPAKWDNVPRRPSVRNFSYASFSGFHARAATENENGLDTLFA